VVKSGTRQLFSFKDTQLDLIMKFQAGKKQKTTKLYILQISSHHLVILNHRDRVVVVAIKIGIFIPVLVPEMTVDGDSARTTTDDLKKCADFSIILIFLHLFVVVLEETEFYIPSSQKPV
jgi:hypothetical protein